MQFLTKSLLLSFTFVFSNSLLPSYGQALLCQSILSNPKSNTTAHPGLQEESPKNLMFYMSRTTAEVFQDLKLPKILHFKMIQPHLLEVHGLPYLRVEASTDSSLIFRLPLGLRVRANYTRRNNTGTLSELEHLKTHPTPPTDLPNLKERISWKDSALDDLILEQALLQAMDSSTFKSLPLLLDEFEQAQQDAFNVFIKLLRENIPLTSFDLKSVNSKILGSKFRRKFDVLNGEIGVLRGPFKDHLPVNLSDGLDLYFLSFEKVPEFIDALIQKINLLGSLSSLKDISSLYQNFMLTHPFVDGNGRTGRALLDYMLLKSGFPPLNHNEATSLPMILTPEELSLIIQESLRLNF